MRARTALVAAAVTLMAALSLVGCRGRWLAGPFQRGTPPAGATVATEPLTWTDASAVVLDNGGGNVRYRLSVPPPAAGAGALRRVEVRFHEPLDGARIDAWAVGARGWLTLVEGKRIGGDTVLVPIPPGDLDRVELAVHHHLRPLPVVRGVRLGRSGPSP